MTSTQFRLILVLCTALTVAGGSADMVVSPDFSPELAAAYEQNATWFDSNFSLAVTIAVLLVATIVAGLIGLFLFKRWGRSLSLYSTLASIALSATLGPSLTSTLASVLLETSSLLWGAILALAYYSPISARFNGEDHQERASSAAT